MGVATYFTDKAEQKVNDNKIAIAANDLNIYYGQFHAVRDVNLQIETHKITSMIGPSGCGKSTV